MNYLQLIGRNKGTNFAAVIKLFGAVLTITIIKDCQISKILQIGELLSSANATQ